MKKFRKILNKIVYNDIKFYIFHNLYQFKMFISPQKCNKRKIETITSNK